MDKGVVYGVAKLADDHMAACMAHELPRAQCRGHFALSGLVRTEAVLKAAEWFDLSNSESPQFMRSAIAALASNPALMAKSGSVRLQQVALDYGFSDIDSKQPRPLTVAEV